MRRYRTNPAEKLQTTRSAWRAVCNSDNTRFGSYAETHSPDARDILTEGST
jgi:hypothetical protein